MVAPSFQSFEFLTEPYSANGKMYICVRNPKTGTERQVRWYDNAEFRKLYPSVKVEIKDKYYRSRKEVLGFNEGYITLASGNEEYLARSSARFHVLWGWYFVSSEPLPDDIPKDVKLRRLDWESVGLNDNQLKPYEDIAKTLQRYKDII